MTNERMIEAEHMVLLLSPQKEMVEIRQKNEEEIRVLQRDNEEKKQ